MQQFLQQSLVVSALIHLTVGLVCLLRRTHRRLGNLYAYLSFEFLAISLLALLLQFEVFRLAEPALAVLVPCAALTCYQFISAFVSELSRPRRTILFLLFGLTGLLGLLGLLERIGGLYLWGAAVLLSVPPCLFGLEALIIRANSSFSRLEKNQLVYLTFGFAILLLAIIGDLIASRLLSQPLSGLWSVGLLGLSILLALNIVRFKFLDLPDMLGWGIATLVTGHLLWALYSQLVTWFELRFGDWAGAEAINTFKMIMATGVFLLLLDPLKKIVLAQVDRVLSSTSQEFQRDLTGLSSSLVSVLKLDAVFEQVQRVLSASPRVARAEILLAHGEGGALRTLFPGERQLAHRLSLNSPLVRLLEEGNRTLVLDELERSLQLFYASEQQKRVADAAKAIRELEGQLIVPLWFQSRLNGVLILSAAEESGPFTTREQEILLSLAGQLAITVENSRIYEQMRQRDRLVAVGEMATGLAHEIRNPLGAIKAAAQTIEPNMVEGEDREFMEILIEEVDRLNDVVTRFLDYANPLRMRLSTFNLNEILHKAIKLMAPEAASRNVELDCSLDEALPELYIDGEQIRQVLINLVLNAIEAIPRQRGGQVSIVTRLLKPEEEEHELGDAIIQVTDNGAGMSRKQLDKIFDPFYTTKGNGTGLGLAITFRIVQAHDGKISVQSEVGRGTSFEIRLPIRQDPESIRRPEPKSLPREEVHVP